MAATRRQALCTSGMGQLDLRVMLKAVLDTVAPIVCFNILNYYYHNIIISSQINEQLEES